MSDKQADEVAQKAGYENAHDFKSALIPSGKQSDWNIMLNKKSGELFLRRLEDGVIIRTYEFVK